MLKLLRYLILWIVHPGYPALKPITKADQDKLFDKPELLPNSKQEEKYIYVETQRTYTRANLHAIVDTYLTLQDLIIKAEEDPDNPQHNEYFKQLVLQGRVTQEQIFRVQAFAKSLENNSFHYFYQAQWIPVILEEQTKKTSNENQ